MALGCSPKAQGIGFVLVQGTNRFVSKCLQAIGPRVRQMGAWVVAVSAGSRMRSPHSIPTLQWQKIYHNQVGGVTKGVYQIGATSKLHRPAPLSLCNHYVKDIMKVDVGGFDIPAPADPMYQPHPKSLVKSLPVPLVISRVTGWVSRKLSRKEIAAAMDIPVSVIPAMEESEDEGCMDKLTSIPSLKIVQAAFNLISSTSSSVKVSSNHVAHSDSKTTTKVSLAGGAVEGIQAAEISKSNTKAVKSDDAATDEDFWNLGAVTPPGEDGQDPSMFNLLTGVYDPNTHGPISLPF